MNRLLLSSLITGSLLLSAVASGAEISVIGQAKLAVDPDIVYVHLALVKRESNFKDAVKKITDARSELRVSLAKEGVNVTDNIDEGALLLSEVFKNEEGKQKSDGWEAKQMIVGKSASKSDAYKLVQSALGAGPVSFIKLEPAIKDISVLEQKVLVLAITDAKNKALAEATAAGLQIVVVQKISESATPASYTIEGDQVALSRILTVIYEAK